MKNYTTGEYYISRNTLLPFEWYIKLAEEMDEEKIKDSLVRIFAMPEVQEALLVSSPDLFNAMKRINIYGTSKDSEKLVESLLKYFIRMTTRTTPFGLFSGISIGKFGKETEIECQSLKAYKKRARVDMQWFLDVIKKIESESDIRSNLKVKFNDYTFQNGNRLYKPYKTYLEHEQINGQLVEVSSSIRYTNQVKLVEKICKEFISVQEVCKKIASKNPEVPFERIQRFVDQLIDNEFLLSELRVPLIGTDALTYVIEILKKDNQKACEYRKQLIKIKEKIEEYNNTEIGSGINLLLQIYDLMKNLHQNQNYLQVDMRTAVYKNLLEEQLKDELECFANAMSKFNLPYQASGEMRLFIDIFKEKYGYAAVVPILELLDEDEGLGFPKHSSKNLDYGTDSIKQNKILEDLKKKVISEALCQQKRSVDIKNQIMSIADEVDQTDEAMAGIQSFELFLLMHYCPDENQYGFTISPIVGAYSAGRSIGRFADMFNIQELNSLMEKSNESEEFIVAEIFEMPSNNARVANVYAAKGQCDYQIALATGSAKNKINISIKDIYIGLEENDLLYIYSKTLNKKIIVTSNSMFNPLLGSTVYQFLVNVSEMYYNGMINIITKLAFWDDIYSPRITFGKIVIKPQQWKVSNEDLGAKEVENERLEQFLKKWNVPQMVYMGKFDNRLLVNLKNKLHIKEVIAEIKKQGYVFLYEVDYLYGYNVMKDQKKEHYTMEMVVPFWNNKVKNKKTSKVQLDVINNKTTFDRKLLSLCPGEKRWWFFKLYGCSQRKVELLSRMGAVCEEYIKEKKIERFFFIQYYDNQYHVRLRIQLSEKTSDGCLEEINAQLTKLKEEGLVSRIVIDTYQREIERYGGSGLIEEAEKFFCDESQGMISVIDQINNMEQVEIDCLGIALMVSTLNVFEYSLREKQNFVEDYGKAASYKKLLSKFRKRYINVISDPFEYLKKENDEVALEFLERRENALAKYAAKIKIIDENNELTNSKEEIIRSIIHMSYNRLIGDTEWEKKVYSLSRDGLYAFVCYERNVKK